MATINLDYAQFWDPFSNSFLDKQYTASSHSMSKSAYTTSSRNQPALLHNKAAPIFKCNDQSTSTIAPAQHQGDDSAARAQGCNSDPTSCDDETDDDLLSIEELSDRISRKGISIGGYRNPKDTLQDLEDPVLDTSGSCLNPIQSKIDNGTGDGQGTRDKPVILEDDESDTPDPEAAAVSAFGLSKPTDPSGHELWYDVEDQRFVDDDICPFPPPEQEGLASMPTPAQDQPHSCHYSPGSSQDQINQHGNDRTRPSTSEEPTPHTLPASLGKNGEGGSEEENLSKLEKDLLLAFEEQDKLLLASASAPAPSSPRLWRHSIEPSHPQIDGAGTVRLEELRHGSPLRSQDRGEEPQKQQQRQEVAAEAMREDDEDKEPEQRGEKRQGANEVTSSDMYHSEDSDRSHKTNEKDAEDDEDDEDPRPAKRRKRPPIPTHQGLTPPYEHGPGPRLGRPHSLTPSSTMQPEIDESPSQADHAHPPTPVDNDYYNTPQTSRSSSVAESTPVAQYQERPFRGFLKCTTIGNQTIYNLEFALPRTCEHPYFSLHSEVLASVSGESPAKAAVSHRVVSKRKPGKELTKEQESLLAKMVHDDQTWTEIGRHFPGHTLPSLKQNFFMKQGGQPRKRGRKASVRASRYIYEDETSFA